MISGEAGGLPYVWIARATIPLGFALLGLQGLACFCASLARLIDGEAKHD